MGGVEEWFEGETSRLEGIIKKAQMQKELADETAKGGWFKSIAEVLSDAGLPTTYLQYTNTASTGLSKLPGWNK